MKLLLRLTVIFSIIYICDQWAGVIWFVIGWVVCMMMLFHMHDTHQKMPWDY